MAPRYNPTPDERRALEALAEEVAGVQRTFVANHPGLAQPDRGAHQPQLGGGKVLLHVNDTLPPELAGLGIFAPTGATPRIGIGRMSNGLGCPHAETAADFLGLMVAFRAPDGRRVDFITINNPGAPTDTPGVRGAPEGHRRRRRGQPGRGPREHAGLTGTTAGGAGAPRGPSRAGHRRAG